MIERGGLGLLGVVPDVGFPIRHSLTGPWRPRLLYLLYSCMHYSPQLTANRLIRPNMQGRVLRPLPLKFKVCKNVTQRDCSRAVEVRADPSFPVVASSFITPVLHR